MAQSHRYDPVVLSRSALEREGALWFGIDGGSMKPFLRTGDRVMVRACPAEALVHGDLVLMTTGGSFCLHRVMASGTENGRPWLRTKGDGCGRWDLPISAESVIGKGVMIQRGDRLLNLESWTGRTLGVLCLYGSVLIGWGLWLKWRLHQ